MRTAHHGNPPLVIANGMTFTKPPGFDMTTSPDWPVAVRLTPTGMFPEASVVNVAEPAGQEAKELSVAPDSKQ